MRSFPNANDLLAFGVLIVAIALPGWVQYARAVRGSTMVERNKEYVQAARVIGVSPLRIMLRHVLPNVLGSGAGAGDDPGRDRDPHRGDAVVPRRRRARRPRPRSAPSSTKATSSFSAAPGGSSIFPGAMLVLIALSINLFGDWLRDALNPRLR